MKNRAVSIVMVWLAICLPRPASATGRPVCVRGEVAMVAAFDPMAVHMYRKTGARWEVTQVLECDETYEDNGTIHPVRFGEDVDLDRDTAVVGAPGRTGSVFVFRLHGEEWRLEQRIVCEDADENQRWRFGAAVAISGDTLVIGNCELDTPDFENTHAYVYVRKGTKWSLQQRLENEGALPYHHFGLSVDVEGDVVVVGARDDRNPMTYSKYPKSTLGSASIFRRTGETWQREQKQWAPASVFRFGQSVALSGERLVVGTLAYNDESLFVYRRGATEWETEEVLKMHDPKSPSTNFGFSVDFDGTSIVANAPFADFTTLFTREGNSWGFGLTFVPASPIRTVVPQGFVSVDGETLLLSSLLRESPQRRSENRKAEVAVFTRNAEGWQRTQDLEPAPTPGN